VFLLSFLFFNSFAGLALVLSFGLADLFYCFLSSPPLSLPLSPSSISVLFCSVLADNSIATSVINYFNCTHIGSHSYLALYPSVSCDEDKQYRAVASLIYLCLVLVVICVPVLLFALLAWGFYTKALVNNDKFRMRYGVLFEVYKPKFFFYEILSLARRVVLITVSKRAKNTHAKKTNR
jgi:hypothetical protein